MIIELIFLAALSPLSAEEPDSARLRGQSAPAPADFLVSPDGRLRWVAGDNYVLVRPGPGKKERRIRLPPPDGKISKRRVLFADRGPRFCLIDEEDQEFGLHLEARRGQESAKALLLASTVRLLDSNGMLLWKRRMPDKAIVGKAGDARALSIGNDGTVAILLQDVDPYAKARPYLYVFDARGRELKSLDYTQWTKIDEFALSADGGALAIRGFGHVPEEEKWSKAFGYYPVRSKKGVIIPMPELDEGRHLRGFDPALWACCAKEGGRLFAIGPAGDKTALSPEEADRRFGPSPSP
ncbi:MAG: hypothetical protein HY922_04135 [Elusimicrobia bacterium]|nr:hypothetical protein [Elusimicrobiota bacterium]